MDSSYTFYAQEDMPSILIDLLGNNMVLMISIMSFIVFILILGIVRRKK